MNHDERQFEELVKKVTFDDKPDYRHRDKLGQQLLAAFAQRQWQQEKQSQIGVWRTIMQKRITKLAAIAAAVIVAGLASWIMFAPDKTKTITSLEFLAKAQAAERSLFTGNRIIHLITEITVYPGTQPKSSEMLDKLGDTTKSGKEIDGLFKNVVDSMMTLWIPVFSMNHDGSLAENKLDIADSNVQKQMILDEAWYEPATGRFARVMESEGKTLFANAYDGQFVYTSQSRPDGTLDIKGNAVEGFRSPENPAEFLGMTAGVQLCLSDKCLRQPIHYIGQETLDDGTIVHVYKAGFQDLWGGMNTYYEFKVRQSDEVVAEIACISHGEQRLTIRRTLNESVDKAGISWNLAELSPEQLAAEPNTAVAVKTNAVIPNVSVRHMVEQAGFETYIFKTSPAWAQERIIVDIADQVNASQRMFAIIYTAGDNRHVVLAQSQTLTKFILSIKQQVESRNGSMGMLDYANGCKLWKNSGPAEKWWTDIILRQSGFIPAEDRSGYNIETPAGTIVSLIVNGRLTETERDSLINSLIPARDFQVK